MPTPEKTGPAKTGPEEHGPPTDPHESENASLRRELLAILVLYVAAAMLPLLIGLAFGPESH